MTVAAQKIAKQALALSESERVKLADILLKSIPKEDDLLSQKDWDEAWKMELEKRIEEIHLGKVKTIPADRVMAELKAKYG